MTTETQIENYLTALRLHLGPLTIAEREEIVREINAHIRDSAEEPGASVESVLARLGPAEELAAQYREGFLIRQASRSISPIVLLRGTLRLATKGVFGILVFFLGLFGYMIGGGFFLTAVIKVIFPANAGMWFKNGYFLFWGASNVPPGPPAYEVLGWWCVPLALFTGSLILVLTTAVIRASLRVSQDWQSKL
ncbi:MAG: hypothetical protein ABSG60_10280 [Terracidiphilus sp.]|jgi:uncharacterized membrane protein